MKIKVYKSECNCVPGNQWIVEKYSLKHDYLHFKTWQSAFDYAFYER